MLVVRGLGDDCHGRHDFPIHPVAFPSVSRRNRCLRAPRDSARDCTVRRRACQPARVPRRAARSRTRSATTDPTGCRSRDPSASRPSSPACRPSAELFRARRRARRRPRHRPPRHLLDGRAAGADAGRQAPPAAAVRARHGARRLPPAARRPPRGRQQRAARRRAGLRVAASRSRCTRGSAIGVAGRFAGDGITAAELVAARARADRPRAARVPRRTRARAHDRHRLRGRLGLPADADRGRPRRVPDRRAGRARHDPGARGGRSISSPPATTRRRPSASAGWAICSPSASAIRHVFVDIPNPI